MIFKSNSFLKKLMPAKLHNQRLACKLLVPPLDFHIDFSLPQIFSSWYFPYLAILHQRVYSLKFLLIF